MPGWVVAELQDTGWPATLVSGLAGALSHVVLDAVIHADVQPLWPWSSRNPLFVPGSFDPVHYACGALGALGLAWWLALARRRPRGAV